MIWLFMIGPGLVALTFGVVFLIAPQRLMQAKPAQGRMIVDADTLFLDHRICTGICLMAVGAFCLLSALYVWVRLNT